MKGDNSPDSILVYVGSDADDAIGENVIKLPFLRALGDAFAGARITWIAGLGPAQFDGPLKPLAGGLIDEFITDLYLSDNPLAVFGRRPPLAGRRFALIIDTQHLPARTLMLRRVPHGCFVSPAWRYAFSDRKPPGGAKDGGTLAERLLVLAAAAAGRPLRPSHIAPLSDAWHGAARALLPSGPVYVGLAPGAGRQGSGKCWPLERFVALARDQSAKGRVPVFFLGPDEAGWLAELRQGVPGAQFPESERAGVPGPLEGPPLVVALARRLAVAVSNCSGTGHLLAAGGAPMVSLFAPTDAAKFAPYTPDLTVIRAQDFAGDGIEAIPLDAVSDAVDARLPAPPSPV
ncbi:MAG: glycosyltransferase family 9 protein [Proteobacteria bacterium]|nr:glycosyltransferase family 9 protein [Pseudomonadota bacterium]